MNGWHFEETCLRDWPLVIDDGVGHLGGVAYQQRGHKLDISPQNSCVHCHNAHTSWYISTKLDIGILATKALEARLTEHVPNHTNNTHT